MKFFIVHFFSFLFLLLCDCNEENREPKFFFGQKKPPIVVSYRNVPKYVTEFVPSSCIVIDPTLSPCRHVRDIEIHPTAPTSIARTEIPNLENFKSNEGFRRTNSAAASGESSVKIPTPPLPVKRQQAKSPQSPYWTWNFLNPFRITNVTRTTTKTQYITTRVEDPHTVVSFHVKGCRPSRLPFDLQECVKPEPEPKEDSIVIMAPLKFITTTDQAMITPSRIVDENGGNLNESEHENQTDSED